MRTAPYFQHKFLSRNKPAARQAAERMKRLLRYLTAGESHGPALTAIIEGMPAGLEIKEEDINWYLSRRQKGYGRGGRMSIEKDRVRITGGIRGGKTLGSPISMVIENKDWENWKHIMAPGEAAELNERKVTSPRPGHADLAGGIKYAHTDLRNVLERASARETAARTVVGAAARLLLDALGIAVGSHVVGIGRVLIPRQKVTAQHLEKALKSPVMCIDPGSEKEMMGEIDTAKAEGDSLGGVFEVLAYNVPVGLGSHVHWDRRLDGRISQALMSIPGIKGVEFGLGFEGAEMKGSEVHDAIYHSPEAGFYRKSNNAGGIEGGLSSGEPIAARAAMKPIPTLTKSLPSVDMDTKEPVDAAVERADACAVPAAAVTGEAVTAFVLAQAVLEKFGGDSLQEIASRLAAYREYERQV